MLLISALLTGAEDESIKCLEYLCKFINTPKFSLCRRFLTRKEKKKVAELVSNLEVNLPDSQELEKVKKAFKIK